MKRKLSSIFALFAVGSLAVAAFGQGSYKQPPKEVLDVLNAPAPPATSIAPSRDRIALLDVVRYPPVSELAEPMLRLAGLRINPRTNAQHRQNYFSGVSLQNIADGSVRRVQLPAGAKIISPAWSPDGKYIAAGNVTDKGVEL